MIKIDELNSHFDPRRFMSIGQYEMLCQQKRIFLTEAKLTLEQVLTYLVPLTDEEKADERHQLKELAGMSDELIDHLHTPHAGRYGGHLIVNTPDSWTEAEEWAQKRGFGEVVKGRLGGAVQLDEKASQGRVRLN